MEAEREIDLLVTNRGTVTAPAGCGKTYLIVDALLRHRGAKPILVLTHTNAGVAALRWRLRQARVRPAAYRLATIDGWAMRLIGTFPQRSGHEPVILRLAHPSADYPAIRASAAALLKMGHLSKLLAATYSQIIVDEYQDCSIRQHAIVFYASRSVPAVVLGDPMQAIFGFGDDPLANWDKHVLRHFPLVGELSRPWRWINAGTEELGDWLLAVRKQLGRGESIDLRGAPRGVTWIHLDGSDDHERRLAAARVQPQRPEGTVLIIGDSTSPVSQRRFASQTPGAVTVEAVDLKDLVTFARQFKLAEPEALERLVSFAQNVMTNVGEMEIVDRVSSLLRGAARKGPTRVEATALAFVESPSYESAVEVLVEIGKCGGVRAYRPAVLRACVSAMRTCAQSSGVSFYDAAVRMREENRLGGRSLPRRAVGSTLLLKGLEAEAVVILHADELDARNLYVAMTRGSNEVHICSASPVLHPR